MWQGEEVCATVWVAYTVTASSRPPHEGRSLGLTLGFPRIKGLGLWDRAGVWSVWTRWKRRREEVHVIVGDFCLISESLTSCGFIVSTESFYAPTQHPHQLSLSLSIPLSLSLSLSLSPSLSPSLFLPPSLPPFPYLWIIRFLRCYSASHRPPLSHGEQPGMVKALLHTDSWKYVVYLQV